MTLLSAQAGDWMARAEHFVALLSPDVAGGAGEGGGGGGGGGAERNRRGRKERSLVEEMEQKEGR